MTEVQEHQVVGTGYSGRATTILPGRAVNTYVVPLITHLGIPRRVGILHRMILVHVPESGLPRGKHWMVRQWFAFFFVGMDLRRDFFFFVFLPVYSFGRYITRLSSAVS